MRVAVAAVIWWMAYSSGYFNCGLDKQQDVEKRQRLEQMKQMKRAEVEYDNRRQADPAPSGCARIYGPGYDEAIGTVLPSGNQWNIHSLLITPTIDGHLVRNGYRRYDILNARAQARVGYVIYDGKQWNIYSAAPDYRKQADEREGYIDDNGDWHLDRWNWLFLEMNMSSDWLKKEMTPVF